MTWRRIAFWTAATALLMAAAASVFLFTADLGFLKAEIERRVTGASGREFSIDGELSMRLGGRATVTADDVRWQNADWAAGGDMLQVRRVEIDIDLLSAVRGPLVIERVMARGAHVQVARNADDESNWAMLDEQATEPDSQRADAEPAWMVRQLDVSDVDIRISRPARPAPLDVRIRSLRQDIGDDDVVSTSLDASAGGREMSLIAKLTTWTTLLARDRIDYELDARLDQVAVSSKGFIDSLAQPRRPALEFSVEGPSVSDLFALAGLGEHGEGDVNLQGSLQPGDNGLLILAVSGNAGQTVVDATGTFSDLQELEHANLSAKASGPNLGRILGLLGIDQVSESPFALTVDLERRGELLIVREAKLDIAEAKLALHGRLPEFPTLANATAMAQMEGPRIERLRNLLPLPEGMAGPFVANVELDAATAGAEVFHINARTSMGHLDATGSIGPPPRHYGSRAHLRFEGESLAGIGAAWDVEDLADVPVMLAGELELTAEGLHTRQPLVATIGAHAASIEGVLGTTSELRGTRLDVALSGKSLENLGGTLSTIKDLPDAPYETHGTININDEGYQLQGFTVEVVDSVLQADGLISHRRGLAGSRLSVSIGGSSLEALLPAAENHRIRPGPFSFSANAAIDAGAIRFNAIRLEREPASVTADLELPWPLSFDSASFELQGKGRDIRALIGAVGTFELDALPYSADISGTRKNSAWTVSRADLKLGDAEARIRGQLDYGDTLNSTHLSIDGVIPSLAALGTTDGKRLRDSPVRVHATFSSDEDTLKASDLRIDIDEGAIGGTVAWRPGTIPALTIDLQSDYLALHPVEKAEIAQEADPEFADGRLIPNIEVPFTALERLNGSLRLAIGEFHRDLLQLRDVSLFAELESGTLTLHELAFRGKSGHFRAAGLLEPAGGAGHAKVDIAAEELRLDVNEDDGFDGMTGDLVVRLESHGGNLRALAGNAEGVLLLDARNGRVRNSRLLQAVYGDDQSVFEDQRPHGDRVSHHAG